MSSDGVGVAWALWSACSVSCGVGVETRRRVLCYPAHRRLCHKVQMLQHRPCVRRPCKSGISMARNVTNYDYFSHSQCSFCQFSVPLFISTEQLKWVVWCRYRSDQLRGVRAGRQVCCSLLLTQHCQANQEDVLGHSGWTSSVEVRWKWQVVWLTWCVVAVSLCHFTDKTQQDW